MDKPHIKTTSKRKSQTLASSLIALNCAECGSVVTDPEKLTSNGATKLGFVLCSFKCAQDWTAATGMV